MTIIFLPRVVVFIAEKPRKNIIFAIQKFEKYKDYPLDIYHRETILVHRMLLSKASINEAKTLHQIWENKKLWLNYTL